MQSSVNSICTVYHHMTASACVFMHPNKPTSGGCSQTDLASIGFRHIGLIRILVTLTYPNTNMIPALKKQREVFQSWLATNRIPEDDIPPNPYSCDPPKQWTCDGINGHRAIITSIQSSQQGFHSITKDQSQ